MSEPATSGTPKNGVRMKNTASAPRANCPKESALPKMTWGAAARQKCATDGSSLPSMRAAKTTLISSPGKVAHTASTSPGIAPLVPVQRPSACGPSSKIRNPAMTEVGIYNAANPGTYRRTIAESSKKKPSTMIEKPAHCASVRVNDINSVNQRYAMTARRLTLMASGPRIPVWIVRERGPRPAATASDRQRSLRSTRRVPRARTPSRIRWEAHRSPPQRGRTAPGAAARDVPP